MTRDIQVTTHHTPGFFLVDDSTAVLCSSIELLSVIFIYIESNEQL